MDAVLRLVSITILSFGLSALSTNAQQVATIEEAAQINSGLALQLCIMPGVEGPQTVASFRQAGFSETSEGNIEDDITFYYTDPSGSVRAEVYYGQMPMHCFVTSEHMGVTTASAVLDQVVPRLYPGFVRRVDAGPIDPATGQPAQCVRYEDPTNPIGYVVGVSPGGGAQGCVENGTSRFYFTARV